MPVTATPAPSASSTHSFINVPGAEPPLWLFAAASSFISIRSPRRRPRAPRAPRARMAASRRVAPGAVWQRLAGRFELAADLARTCARVARAGDPAALDEAVDRWREVVLDAIALHNLGDEYLDEAVS